MLDLSDMKLSIITINYNDREGLRRTLQSVAAQTCTDFEYIVIDGGSTDGSVDVIKEYAPYITYWVSEPDKGIYNAMNKGVAKAHGDFCQFLNSGDWLYSDDVVSEMLEFLTSNVDIVLGQTWSAPENGKSSELFKNLPMNHLIYRLLVHTLPHQSAFIRRSLLVEYPYDESLRLVSDWKFYLEVYLKESPRISYCNKKVALFDTTGVSSTNPSLLEDERRKVLDELMRPSELMAYYNDVPEKVYCYFGEVPHSYRFKNFLAWIIGCNVGVYKFLMSVRSLFRNSDKACRS